MLDAALAGDEDAALDLYMDNPSDGLCLVALAAFWGGTPLFAYRELLCWAWCDDWYGLLMEAGRDSTAFVRRLFRAGHFEHHLSGKVQIYRGAHGVDVATAYKGVSWTINRDVACYFATMRPEREPVVVTALVEADAISHYENMRFEQEVILRRAVQGALDGDPASWQAAARRYGSTVRPAPH